MTVIVCSPKGEVETLYEEGETVTPDDAPITLILMDVGFVYVTVNVRTMVSPIAGLPKSKLFVETLICCFICVSEMRYHCVTSVVFSAGEKNLLPSLAM